MPESHAHKRPTTGKVHAIRERGALLADRARRQGGVVSTPQLYQLGFSGSEIERMCAGGHLLRLYQGVYAVGHLALRSEERRVGKECRL